jgi:uncharacterized protein YdeI (YjbR/CyaY-like superfamily)
VKQDGGVSAPSDLPVHRFGDQAAFEAWLEDEHARSPGIHVVIAKKGAPQPTLTQSEMVESLLCFGWIDSQVRRLDEHHFLTRVTPRRPRSVWSARNVEWIGRLIEAGRMRPAGLAAVEAAQADGRWDRAYAGPAAITVPDDLTAALAAHPGAAEFFSRLDAQNRYAVLWRVHTAATPQTRAKRIAALAQMLAEGRTFH